MKKVWNLITGLVLAAFIVSAAVVAVFNFRPLYVQTVRSQKISEVTGMSEEEILAQYDALIAYNQPWGPEELKFPDLPSSDSGLVHFREVKAIYAVFFYTLLASLLLLVPLIGIRARCAHRGAPSRNRPVPEGGNVRHESAHDGDESFRSRFVPEAGAARRGRARADARAYLVISGVSLLSLVLLIGVGVTLFWDRFFVFFHEVLFPNDYWVFSPKSDPVILLLPDTYFLYCALAILGLVAAGAALCLILAIRFRRHRREDS